MRTGMAILMCAACVTATAAVQMTLDPRDVNEAIRIGQSRIQRDRTRFHAPYRLAANKAPVDYVEVVTPFRRVVIAAESAAEIGDRTFGQRRAFDVLDAAPGQIDLRVELTFHPLNTYVGVPAYAILVVARDHSQISPRTLDRQPRFGLRVEGLPSPLAIPGAALKGGSQPLLGGTVVAQFESRLLEPAGVYDVVVEEAGKELVRVRADLGTMR